jgi:hypothetical protein
VPVYKVIRLFTIVMASSVALGQVSSVAPTSAQDADSRFPSRPENTASTLSALPPAPAGKSTVIGGVIHNVDPVRDQLTLKVFGSNGRPMKILFDERTQVYRDGARASLRDLHSDDHASIETVLDGTNIFAVSVHMLSRSPEGECQGQVVEYNPGTAELTLKDALSNKPIKLQVPPGTAVVRVGQMASSSDDGQSLFAKGTLVAVTFESDNKGRATAHKVSILATPGASFEFSGNVSFIDLHAQLLVVTDSASDQSYKLSVTRDQAPALRDLHEGASVTVTAFFDGTRYIARDIATR